MLEAGSKQRSGETAVSIPVIVSLVMCNSKVNVFACTALSVNMLTSDAALAHTSCCIHCRMHNILYDYAQRLRQQLQRQHHQQQQ
eukprot:16801-Heterococcus_DN1.PRE.1